MKYCSTQFAGQELVLHGEKLLWFPRERMLCAADIHFEKGSFFRRFGTLLPPYDTEETLEVIARGIAYFKPRLFIALGDSFHDRNAGERLSGSQLSGLSAVIASVSEWIWVTGNHDPAIDSRIPGNRVEEGEFSGILFRHELEVESGMPEISGHYHPKASVKLRGHRLSAACFVQSTTKIVMPAIGHFTGGLFVHDPAFASLIPPSERALFLTYQSEIYPLS